MSLRDDVRAMLDGPGPDVDALGDAGDLPPDLVGTALGHFADTSSLADADALAPVVTSASPVPFDPELDGVGEEPVSEANVDPDDFDRAEPEHSDEDPDGKDSDPGDFDDSADGVSVNEEPADEAPVEPVDGDGPGVDPTVDEFERDGFGSGSATGTSNDVSSADVADADVADAESLDFEEVYVDAVGEATLDTVPDAAGDTLDGDGELDGVFDDDDPADGFDLLD